MEETNSKTVQESEKAPVIIETPEFADQKASDAGASSQKRSWFAKKAEKDKAKGDASSPAAVTPVKARESQAEYSEPAAWGYFKMLPVITFFCSILMVRLHVYYKPLNQYYWTSATDTTPLTDIYSYFKMVVIVGSAAAALLIMIIDRLAFKHRMKWNTAYLFIAIYSAMVVVSCIMSEHKYFAIYGGIGRFEGAITILSYMVMLVYMIHNIRKAGQIKLLLVFICITLILLGYIGYKQSKGEDIFMTDWGQKLITPKMDLADGRNTWEAIDDLWKEGETSYGYRSGGYNAVYETLYNPNYVPMYICGILPLISMLFAYLWKKTETEGSVLRLIGMILYGCIIAITSYNMFCAHAANGFAGVAATVVIAILFFHIRLAKIVQPVIAVLLIFGIMGANTSAAWSKEVVQVRDNLQVLVPTEEEPQEDNTGTSGGRGTLSAALSASESEMGNVQGIFILNSQQVFADGEIEAPKFDRKPRSLTPVIDYIHTYEDTLEMSINGNPLFVKVFSDGKIIFYDADDEFVIPNLYDEKNNLFEFWDTRFHDYINFTYFVIDDGRSIIIRMGVPGRNWDFRVDMVSGGVYYQTMAGKETALGDIESWGFENNMDFGSGRGYIWSRSIPLLKHYLVTGAGADCYCAVFPQNDYAFKYSYRRGHFYEVIDKPHDLYIQIAINTGLISLIAWFGIIVAYMVRMLKSKIRFTSFEDFVQAGCFLGVIGFLASAVFNDSSVSTMPTFYTMLGLGLALTGFKEKQMIKPKEKKPAKPKAGKGKHAKGSAQTEDTAVQTQPSA